MRRLGFERHIVDYWMLQVVTPDWVAKALRLDPATDESVLRIQRLRYADNEPLSLMVDYLRLRFVPDLALKGIEGESLYETLEKRYNLELAWVDDTVTTGKPPLVRAGR